MSTLGSFKTGGPLGDGEVIRVAMIVAVTGVTTGKTAGAELVAAAGTGKTGIEAETTRTVAGTIGTVVGTTRTVVGSTRTVVEATITGVVAVTIGAGTTGIVVEGATKTVAGDVAGATSRGGTTELEVLCGADSTWYLWLWGLSLAVP